MIVKIENLEELKEIQDIASLCDKELSSNMNNLFIKPPCLLQWDVVLSYFCEDVNYVFEDNDSRRFGLIDFEQFKAQREEPIKTDLEKENEELKKKLREIELHVNISITGFGDIKISNGYQMALNDIKKLFQTPQQKEANEIFNNQSKEVLEELKKLL